MANNPVEQLRLLHEQLETIQHVVVDDLVKDARHHKQRMLQDHAVKERLRQYTETAKRILESYDDDKGPVAREIAAVSGQPVEEEEQDDDGNDGDKMDTSSDGKSDDAGVFKAFYARVQETHNYHRRFHKNIAITQQRRAQMELSGNGDARGFGFNEESNEDESAKERAAAAQLQAQGQAVFVDKTGTWRDPRMVRQMKKAAAAAAGGVDGAAAKRERKKKKQARYPKALVNRVVSLFADDEHLGRHVRLTKQFELFVNMPNVFYEPEASYRRHEVYFDRRRDYVSFLTVLPSFEWVRRRLKTHPVHGKAYTQYLKSTLAYLVSFHERTRPLVPVGRVIKVLESHFAKVWQAREVPGWFDTAQQRRQRQRAAQQKQQKQQQQQQQQQQAQQQQQQQQQAQQQQPPEDLYCAVCDKTFAKATVMQFHMKSKRHLKKAKALAHLNGGSTAAAAATTTTTTATNSESKTNGVASSESESSAATTTATTAMMQQHMALAMMEFKIKHLLRHSFPEEVQDTIDYIEKRQTKTLDELEAERANGGALDSGDEDGANGASDGDSDADSDDDSDDDGVNLNPKNLPIGWDGKPMPYWMWKLQGLNLEFKCEICGDFTYHGPRQFDEHFQQSRHSAGMRSLGIPNSTHFHGVTKIEDAVKLHEKMNKLSAQLDFVEDEEEEFEDEHGNVFNKKTYRDLRNVNLIK